MREYTLKKSDARLAAPRRRGHLGLSKCHTATCFNTSTPSGSYFPLVREQIAATEERKRKKERDDKARNAFTQYARQQRVDRPKALTLHITGNLIAVEQSRHDPPQRNRPIAARGDVRGFSKKSRSRMMETLARLGDSKALFVTLTYGEFWPVEKRELKSHLDKFWKMVERKEPGYSAIWKAEIQESRLEKTGNSVPHFHLLVYAEDGSAPFLDKDWVAAAWAKASCDESPSHVSAGTQVVAMRSHRGSSYYMSKYMSKETAAEWPYGRAWGVRGKDRLPVKDTVRVQLTESQSSAYEKAIQGRYAEMCAIRQAMAEESGCNEIDDLIVADREARIRHMWLPYYEDRFATFYKNNPGTLRYLLYDSDPWKFLETLPAFMGEKQIIN